MINRIKGLFTANDMTEGTPWKSIARFAFSMLIGNFAQQLYNTVDAVVVGRSKWGYTALASVGNALPVLTAAVLVPVIIICGPFLMDLFAPGNTELIDLAMSMMYILAVGYIAVGVSQSLQGVIRGAGDTMTPMWITIATTVLVRIPLAYGLVALTRSMGAPLRTQEKMVFVSLLTIWIVGAAATVILYYLGRWREKIPDFE